MTRPLTRLGFPPLPGRPWRTPFVVGPIARLASPLHRVLVRDRSSSKAINEKEEFELVMKAAQCGEGFDRTSEVEGLPQFLTIEEAACYLGIGRTLAYEMVRTGALSAIRFGRLIRISRESLIRMARPTAA